MSCHRAKKRAPSPGHCGAQDPGPLAGRGIPQLDPALARFQALTASDGQRLAVGRESHCRYTLLGQVGGEISGVPESWHNAHSQLTIKIPQLVRIIKQLKNTEKAVAGLEEVIRQKYFALAPERSGITKRSLPMS